MAGSRYVTPGTDIAYDTTRKRWKPLGYTPFLCPIVLRSCYGSSGTDITLSETKHDKPTVRTMK
eukprot:259552-Rhodomonas_salina.3